MATAERTRSNPMDSLGASEDEKMDTAHISQQMGSTYQNTIFQPQFSSEEQFMDNQSQDLSDSKQSQRNNKERGGTSFSMIKTVTETRSVRKENNPPRTRQSGSRVQDFEDDKADYDELISEKKKNKVMKMIKNSHIEKIKNYIYLKEINNAYDEMIRLRESGDIASSKEMERELNSLTHTIIQSNIDAFKKTQMAKSHSTLRKGGGLSSQFYDSRQSRVQKDMTSTIKDIRSSQLQKLYNTTTTTTVKKVIDRHSEDNEEEEEDQYEEEEESKKKKSRKKKLNNKNKRKKVINKKKTNNSGPYDNNNPNNMPNNYPYGNNQNNIPNNFPYGNNPNNMQNNYPYGNIPNNMPNNNNPHGNIPNDNSPQGNYPNNIPNNYPYGNNPNNMPNYNNPYNNNPNNFPNNNNPNNFPNNNNPNNFPNNNNPNNFPNNNNPYDNNTSNFPNNNNPNANYPNNFSYFNPNNGNPNLQNNNDPNNKNMNVQNPNQSQSFGDNIQDSQSKKRVDEMDNSEKKQKDRYANMYQSKLEKSNFSADIENNNRSQMSDKNKPGLSQDDNSHESRDPIIDGMPEQFQGGEDTLIKRKEEMMRKIIEGSTYDTLPLGEKDKTKPDKGDSQDPNKPKEIGPSSRVPLTGSGDAPEPYEKEEKEKPKTEPLSRDDPKISSQPYQPEAVQQEQINPAIPNVQYGPIEPSGRETGRFPSQNPKYNPISVPEYPSRYGYQGTRPKKPSPKKRSPNYRPRGKYSPNNQKFPNNPRYPQRGNPRNPQRDNPLNPQSDYPRNPQRDNPRNPQSDYPRNPQIDYPRNPQSDYPRNPQSDYPRNPQSDYPRNPSLDNPRNPQSDYPNNPYYLPSTSLDGRMRMRRPQSTKGPKPRLKDPDYRYPRRYRDGQGDRERDITFGDTFSRSHSRSNPKSKHQSPTKIPFAYPTGGRCFACDVNCSISRSGNSPNKYVPYFPSSKIERKAVTDYDAEKYGYYQYSSTFSKNMYNS